MHIFSLLLLLRPWSLPAAAEQGGQGPSGQGTGWTLSQGRLSLGEQLLEDVVGTPSQSADGRRLVAARGSWGQSELWLWEQRAGLWSEPRLLNLGRADQPALSPDGRWLAFVRHGQGVGGVSLLELDSGELLHLTNVDLRPQPGKAPLGFVPLPSTGISWCPDQSCLRWSTAEGSLAWGLP
jgi:hypothetical protein